MSIKCLDIVKNSDIESYFKDITDSMSEDQQRDEALKIAVSLHKQLHDSLNPLRKEIGLSVVEYKKGDTSAAVKKVNDDYNARIEAVKAKYRNANKKGVDSTFEEFEEEIERMHASKSPEERKKASDLDYIKYDMVVRTIAKMIDGIRREASSRKGVEISQLKVFDEIVKEGTGLDMTEQLKMPLTFTPGNKQYQQVVLANLQKLVQGSRINGFSGVQISTAGFGVRGDATLKNYELVYDKDDKVIGFNNAEIAVPWIFRDKAGKLLDWNTYVNKDGTPKLNMFTKEMLNIIGYRIPNTGPNMAGVFTIAKFFEPGYSDAIMIPDYIYAQMGSDLDFDKLYNYLFNYDIDAKTGKISKVQGVINQRQKGAYSILRSPQAVDMAIHNILLETDPSYRIRSAAVTKAYRNLNNMIQDIRMEIEDDEQFTITDGIISKDDIDDLETNWKLTGKKKVRKGISEAKDEIADDRMLEEAKETVIKQRTDEIKKQFDSLISEYNKLEERKKSFKTRPGGFDIKSYLANKHDNYIKVQTLRQLENAYIDIYHIVMKDMNTLKDLLTPLTADDALEAINAPIHNGKSFVELKQSQLILAPNTEVFQTANRARSADADKMIGILANSANTVVAAQEAGISLGTKNLSEENMSYMPAIWFKNDDGSVIEENNNEESQFVRRKENDELQAGRKKKDTAGYIHNPMKLIAGEETFDVPNRLDRIFDVTGTKDPMRQLQSLLQGYLDMQKSPEIAYSYVNGKTANAAIVMNRLGYVDQMIPFMQQEIIQQYSDAANAEDSPFVNDTIHDLILRTLQKAGLPIDEYEQIWAALEGDDIAALDNYLANKKSTMGGEHSFSLKDLNGMIVQQFSIDKPQSYWFDQLYVLRMFNRMSAIGKQLLEVNQDSNLQSKGFTTKSILGVVDSINRYNQLGFWSNTPNLIGAERIGPWNATYNPQAVQTVFSQAYATIKKASEWLHSNHNIFSDLSPSFTAIRDMMAVVLNQTNVKQQERININFVQYILSNPELYTDFTEFIPEADRGSAHGIRKHIFLDEITTEKKPGKKVGMSKIVSTVHKSSLARMIESIKDEINPETGAKYALDYKILTYFKTSVKPDTRTPSWVYNYNTNNFRERIAEEIPYNVMIMKNDKNPKIREIANGFFLYYYLGSGITSPVSFGNMLPQEFLFLKNGFADKLNQTLRDLDVMLDEYSTQAKSRVDENYPMPFWYKYFDPNVIDLKTSRQGLGHAKGFFTQFLQKNPFDIRLGNYMEGTHFENVPGTENTVRILKEGLVKWGDDMKPPVAFRDNLQNVYIINSKDPYTFTRFNKSSLPNYAEYNYGKQFSETHVSGNKIKMPSEIDESQLGLDPIKIGDEVTERPFKLDKESLLLPAYDWYFGENNRNDEDIDALKTQSGELNQLNGLARALRPFIPETTVVTPYSIKGANKMFNPFANDGHITVDGRDALGSFSPHTNSMALAMEYLENVDDPLSIKKVMIHESAHAATTFVIDAMEQLEEGKMTKKDVIAHLSLKDDSQMGNPMEQVSRMIKAYKRLAVIYTAMKDNPKLKQHYISLSEDKEAVAATKFNHIHKDMKEFVAYMFNDKAYREALKQIPYQEKTLFQAIMDYLAKLLGLTNDTAAYYAFGNVFAMIESVKNNYSVAVQVADQNRDSKKPKKGKKDTEGDDSLAMFEAAPDPLSQPTEERKLFYLRAFDNDAMVQGKKTITIRSENLLPGVYRLGDDYYRISARGLKRISEVKEKPEVFRNKFIGDQEIKYGHVEDFFANRLPMYVYDIEKLKDDGTLADRDDYRGNVNIRSKDPDGFLATGDALFDKYITVVNEYISRLKDERRAVKGDLKKVQDYSERISHQEKVLSELLSNRTIHFLIESGEQQIDDIKTYALKADANWIELTEGLRVAEAWANLSKVMDLSREGREPDQVKVIDQGRDLQEEAAIVQSALWNKLADKVKDEARKSNIDISSLLDKNNEFKFRDINIAGTNFISGSFSTNPLEQFLSLVMTRTLHESNEEHYEWMSEADSVTNRLLGSTNADDKFMIEEFEQEDVDSEGKKTKVKKQGIISMYDRKFLDEYLTMKSEAIRTKKWKPFYKFENKHFDYELTPEGKQDYERYMEQVRQSNIRDVDENNEFIYDEEAIEAERKRYDPAIFQEYLNNPEEMEANAGGRWYTKIPKNIPLNKNYTALTATQKEYHQWFVTEYGKAYENSIFDYRLGNFDMDQLLMDFVVETGQSLGSRAKYIGNAALEWLHDSFYVTANSTSTKVITRTLTDKPHLNVEFKPVMKFMPGYGRKLNPGEVLRKFRAASIAYRHKRKVEELLNVVADISIIAKKQQTNNSGIDSTNRTGSKFATKEETNTGKRMYHAIESFLTERSTDAHQTGKGVKPGDSGLSLTRTLDSVNKYTRFTFMALSPLSAANNLLMGNMNNVLYAASGKWFNDKELAQAMWMMKGAIPKMVSEVATGKKYVLASDTTKLIAEIMYRYNILGDVTESLAYGDNALSKFFILQKGGEFLVQGSSAVAQMLHMKVENKEGKKVSLLSMYKLNKDGRAEFNKEDLADTEPMKDPEKLRVFFERVKLVNQKIHGDYTHVMLAKKTVWGRVLLLFRTWLPMSVKERFGAQYEHEILGTEKGRYISVIDVFKESWFNKKGTYDGNSNDRVLDSLKILGKLVPGLNHKIKLSDRIPEVDRLNIDMFIREMQLLIAMYTAAATAKSLAAGGDEDDETKNMLKYITNQAGRLQSELSFYYSPTNFQALFQSIVPMTSTLENAFKVGHALIDYVGDPKADEYQTGFRKGNSKLATRIRQFFPLSRPIETTWSSFSNIYNNDRFK